MKHALVFVATTPFAVNAFLRTHLLALAQKYDVTLCVNTAVFPLVEDLAQAISIKHIDIERKIAPLRDVRALFQLIQFLSEKRPAVVHSITPKAGLLAMVAARFVNVSWRFHTFTGQVWGNKKGVSRLVMKAIDRLIAICASRVFADSASQCRFLENEGVVRFGGICVLGQGSVAGVDLARFHPDGSARMTLRSELGISAENQIFLFVGRMVRDKGVYDLIDAFALVNSKHPNWELWMVGPDEESIQAELEMCSATLGISARWFGPTTCPERYMAAADVFVLPSYREGFGSVIIEAAACGIPCIAYRIDGVLDAIVENRTGIFVDTGDIYSLANSMSLLGSKPNIRRHLGEAALMRAVKEFSSDTVSIAWKDFYSTVFQEAI